ncbi:hypothetical protein JAAARDRAFT_111472, partial [Jaapia argillacea MUCL 33604]
MGSDFCSAPATSVDAERFFSEGRRGQNFMQHNLANQTFRAGMALGSWDETPLFPGMVAAAEVIEKVMAGDL